MPLTCFLSYRFNPRARAYAETLKRFLDLTGVAVETGEGYQPRSITDKVRERLAKADFDILIVTTDEGESAWTRDEINQIPDKRVFPLVEEGAKFEPGLFGSHERIPFPVGLISETFVPILEGIQYLSSLVPQGGTPPQRPAPAKLAFEPIMESYDGLLWEERPSGRQASGPFCPRDEVVLDFVYGNGRRLDAEENSNIFGDEIRRLTANYNGESLHDAVGYEGSFLECPACKTQFTLGEKAKALFHSRREVTKIIEAKRRKQARMIPDQ